jgi:hypothetical protein
MGGLGHGVQFLHDDLACAAHPKGVVAFLEGYGPSDHPMTVRLLSIRPPQITPDHWSEIMKSTREAVFAFLSNEENRRGSFRHGPIHVIFTK